MFSFGFTLAKCLLIHKLDRAVSYPLSKSKVNSMLFMVKDFGEHLFKMYYDEAKSRGDHTGDLNTGYVLKHSVSIQ
jgi:hypothetical protein